MDRVMRCLSGSVAVSAYELESLPLPAADVLGTWEHFHGVDLETRVANAYRPGT
jgi:adenine-specific DNA-methyltransferase